MSCQECMYISGHSDSCTTGMSDRISRVEWDTERIAALEEKVESLESKIEDLLKRLASIEEDKVEAREADHWRRMQGP